MTTEQTAPAPTELSKTARAFYGHEAGELARACTEEYGAEVWAWLKAEIAQVFKNPGEYEYDDNHRLALVGNAVDEERYDEIAAGGCCGSAGFVFTHEPTGKAFRYGFNYGH